MIVASGSGLKMSVAVLNAKGSVWSASGIGRTLTAHHLRPQPLDLRQVMTDVPLVSPRVRTNAPKRNVSEVARISVCQVAWVVCIDRRY
jgi:hypothetical protein